MSPKHSGGNSEKDAWERLNELPRLMVATINPKFQAREWTKDSGVLRVRRRVPYRQLTLSP